MKKDFIFKNVDVLKGVGSQLSKYLKNRKIEKIKDIFLIYLIQKLIGQNFINLTNLKLVKYNQ